MARCMQAFRYWTAAISALALAGGTALWAHAAGAAQTAGKPRRIVSVNLCADQLVLALADRDQIAGLTRNALDVEMSGAADKARGLPILGTSADAIDLADPDLVIGMPARRSPAMMVLKDRNYRTLDLQTPETIDQIYTAIRQTAAAVGHPDRGEALIATMRHQLAQIPRPGGGRVAAYYQRRGYMTGTGTLIDDLMKRVGLQNLATKLGKPVLSRVSLEEMVAARPDYLIVESATNRVTDQGTEMLHHPVLRDIARISVPQAWTVCGSPDYVRAARAMADQLGRHS